MIGERLRVGVERAMALRAVRKAEPGFWAHPPKDANNAFSLHDAAAYPGIRAVSFDFFDTLAFRQRLSLDEVFRKTAGFAADIVPGERARVARQVYAARGFPAEALKRVWLRAGKGDEPGLPAIFAEALRPLVADPAERARLARRLTELEALVEGENLALNPEAIPVLRSVRASGRQTIVASDMYLPGWAMAGILEKLGLSPWIDHLIVSADHGVTKRGGALFPLAAEAAGLPPDAILHIGDNWESDVANARRQGFRALHYVSAEGLAGARRLAYIAETPASDHLRRAEIARRYRMADRAPLATLDRVIDEAVGPAAGLFALDLLLAAERRGASHLYFLTRDGTIFHEIAQNAREAIPGLFGGDARLCVLATSRATGALLKHGKADADSLIATVRYLGAAPFSLARLFALFGLADGDFAACEGALRDTLALEADTESEAPFREAMAAKSFAKALSRALARKRGELLAYLESQGVFAAKAPVFADIGYSGTWAKQLSHAYEDLEARGARVPDAEFRFFASNRYFEGNVPRLHAAISMVPGFMLDHRDGACLEAGMNFAWLEPFFADPALGALQGFAPSAQGPRPIFAEARSSPEALARRARIVGRATETIADFFREGGDLLALRDIVRARLVRLAARPRPVEARAMAALTHQRGTKALSHQPLSRRVFPARIARIAELRANDYWVQGSLSLSGLGALAPLLSLHPSLSKIPPKEPAR